MKAPGSPPVEDPVGEISALIERYGDPIRDIVQIPLAMPVLGQAGLSGSSSRKAEVVLIVPRAQDRVLIHTKSFYPSGVWRLPTGGIEPGERIEEAVLREAQEETGQALRPVRFLFRITYRWQGAGRGFDSHGFIMDEALGEIRDQEPAERIAAFRDASREEIDRIAAHLESLSGSWRSWGLFRARPHRLLSQLWAQARHISALAAPTFPGGLQGEGPNEPSDDA